MEDLAAFFDAREREDGVNAWLVERQEALRAQAAQRRAAHRLQGGTALRALRDRGETLREIGRMAGISEKAVRELIREAEPTGHRTVTPADGAEAPSGAVSETLGRTEVAVHGTEPDARDRETVAARV